MGDEKRKEEEEDGNFDNEETLSLCDLPINGDEDQENIETKCLELQDFEFGSTKSEMCVADDVFFKGQLLPLLPLESLKNRSESTEHNPTETITSSSTNTSSTSTSSTNTSSTSTSSTNTSSTSTRYKPKFGNQFHSLSHPSPKPQDWVTGTRTGNQTHPTTRLRKSSVWGLFKVGLVRTTPEMMEVQRSFNSRSSSSNSSGSGSKNSKENQNSINQKKKPQPHKHLFDSCKCDAVEIVPEKIILVKKGSGEKQQKEKKLRKLALHQRRTSEWLKELSVPDLPVEV